MEDAHSNQDRQKPASMTLSKLKVSHQEEEEIFVVQCPDTIDNPNTMMVHLQYTPPT